MSAPKISRIFYEQMVAAFAARPGEIGEVAKQLGVARATARQGWNTGWSRFEWARPIKQVLADANKLVRQARGEAAEIAGLGAAGAEVSALLAAVKRELAEAAQAKEAAQTEAAALQAAAEVKAKEIEAKALAAAEARLKRVEEEARVRIASLMDQAKVDSLTTAIEEAQGVSLGRKAAQGVLALSVQMLQYGKVLQRKFELKVTDPNWDPTPGQMVYITRELGRIVDLGNRAFDRVMIEERRRTGEPTEVIAIREEGVSLEEQKRLAEELQQAVAEEEAKLLAGGDASTQGEVANGTSGSSNGVVH